MVDDVRAVVVHALGRGLALGRVTEAGEVRHLGEVGDVDLDVGVDRLGTGDVAGLELLDQRGLDAADEADVVVLGLQRRSGTDQERALLLGEDQAGDVVGLHAGVVDDREVDVGVLLGDLADRGGVGEADRDDRVVAGVGEGAQALLAGRLGLAVLGLGLLGLHAELVHRLVEARGSGVVEGLVTATAHVVGHADLDVAGGGVPVVGALVGALVGATRRQGERGGHGHRCKSSRLPHGNPPGDRLRPVVRDTPGHPRAAPAPRRGPGPNFLRLLPVGDLRGPRGRHLRRAGPSRRPPPSTVRRW